MCRPFSIREVRLHDWFFIQIYTIQGVYYSVIYSCTRPRCDTLYVILYTLSAGVAVVCGTCATSKAASWLRGSCSHLTLPEPYARVQYVAKRRLSDSVVVDCTACAGARAQPQDSLKSRDRRCTTLQAGKRVRQRVSSQGGAPPRSTLSPVVARATPTSRALPSPPSPRSHV